MPPPYALVLDARVATFVVALGLRYLGNEFGEKSDKAVDAVTAAAVYKLASESFPMCMRHSHEHIVEHHHIKHGGRMQYGLFLKGIGLSLEEALLFWRTEFGKTMGMDKFEKTYSYNIRHNYGKEGKRTDYTPYSCMKIIMSNTPGTGDAHGCPFRHFDQDGLKLRMMQWKVNRARPLRARAEIAGVIASQWRRWCKRDSLFFFPHFLRPCSPPPHVPIHSPAKSKSIVPCEHNCAAPLTH